MQQLVDLLATFGVQSLTQLPQNQYGKFAEGLKALGAQL
jgi:hypothetical protein